MKGSTMFENGSLMPSRYDACFRYVDTDRDEWTGSTEWTGYATLVLLSTAEILLYASTYADDDARLGVKPGWFIVWTNDAGIIWVYQYDSEDAARVDFDAVDVEYSAWLEEEN